MKVLTYITIGVVAVNVIFFGLWISRAIKAWRWDRSHGVIVKIDMVRLGDGFAWIPCVKYEVNGQTVEARYTGQSGDDRYVVGQECIIFINPKKPDEFVLDGAFISIMPLVFLLLVDMTYLGEILKITQ